jgi:hypothetical protein
MNLGRAWVNLAHDKDQCEYVNELAGSIKFRELATSEEGRICMEAVG